MSSTSGADKATILVEALPYIRRFWGTTVVVKYGGNAMTDPALAMQFAEDIVLMHSVGMGVVVVHGGGPQIGELMAKLGKEPEFRDGLRVTDAETLDIARMVLVGKVGRDIVSSINVHAPLAVGLSGEDAGLIVASALDPELGFVGDVDTVDPSILQRLLAEDLIPILSTIGSDAAGQAYNINADTVAGAVGAALGINAMVADGTVAGGMIPKVSACLHAVRGGVTSAHVLDGRLPHVLLLELFTDEGVGTMITKDPQ